MKKYFFLIPVISLFALVLSVNTSQAQKKNTHPNIIYIYADDMGYGDAGCYGQKYIKTPNIDRMAYEGIRFTQHYSGAPVSAPARCSLLTGKNTGHTYVRNNRDDITAFKTGELPEGEETIAGMLKKSGYATAVIGKWGLGRIESSGNPNKQGFDFFYGYADQTHAHNHFPTFLWRNGEQEFLENDVPSVHPKYERDQEIDAQTEYKKYMGSQYSLDLMTDEAMKFIDKNRKTPFFLYIPYIIPHKALQVPNESMKIYDGVFDEEPYDGRNGYTPHPKPLSAYAAMITRMDQKIGIILDYVKKLGIDENTIVMFSSDNGPAGGGGLDARFFNSSGGLRGMKGQLYEGGIREPFVVRWPGKIKAGVTSNHISAQYDLMATLAELTDQNITDTDGISFLPTLLGQTNKQRQHDYLYWEFSSGGGQLAVRMGKWKGMRTGVSRNPDAKWEIYDLDSDKAETKNIADEHPELIVKFDEIVNKRTPSYYAPWNFMIQKDQK